MSMGYRRSWEQGLQTRGLSRGCFRILVARAHVALGVEETAEETNRREREREAGSLFLWSQSSGTHKPLCSFPLS